MPDDRLLLGRARPEVRVHERRPPLIQLRAHGRAPRLLLGRQPLFGRPLLRGLGHPIIRSLERGCELAALHPHGRRLLDPPQRRDLVRVRRARSVPVLQPEHGEREVHREPVEVRARQLLRGRDDRRGHGRRRRRRRRGARGVGGRVDRGITGREQPREREQRERSSTFHGRPSCAGSAQKTITENMSEIEPTKRFSDRVGHLRPPHRPSPPPRPSARSVSASTSRPRVVADIGAGTGIFSALLVADGFDVIGAEPNAAMREASALDASSTPARGDRRSRRHAHGPRPRRTPAFLRCLRDSRGHEPPRRERRSRHRRAGLPLVRPSARARRNSSESRALRTASPSCGTRARSTRRPSSARTRPS